MSMSLRLSDKIVTNTLFNTAGRFWQVLVSFFLTPYILHHLGLELFAAWALIGALIGYIGLFDLGVGNAFVKFIAQDHALGEERRINETVRAGLLIYSLVGLLILLIAPACFPALFRVLHFPADTFEAVQWAFRIGLVFFVVKSLFGVYGAVLSGLQRMDLANKIQMASSIPRVLGTLYVLEAGHGIVGLMLNELAVVCLSGLLQTRLAYRVLPGLTVRAGGTVSWKSVKTLFGFGMRIHVSTLASYLNLHLDKFLIAFFVNGVLVGFYEIASRLSLTARSFPSLLVSAVMPAVSELNARNERRRIYDLFLFGSKCVVLVGTPLMFFVALTASDLITLWMGRGYEEAVPVVQLLALAYYTVIPTAAISHTVQGLHKPEYQMKAAFFVLVFNTLLSTLLVARMGFLGAPLGTFVASLLSLVYYTTIVLRYFERSVAAFFRDIYEKPVLISLALCLLLYVSGRMWTDPDGSQGRLAVLWVLSIKAMLFFGLYAGAMLVSNYLKEGDRRFFRLQLHRVLPRF